MDLVCSCSSQCWLNHAPFQYAPKPIVLDASVKMLRWWAGVQWVSRNMALPFHELEKVNHHFMSSSASGSMEISQSSSSMEWAVSSNLRRKILPAGMTLQPKESFPMRDRSWRFVQVWFAVALLWKCCSSCWRAMSFSSGSRASSATVSSRIPSIGRVVVGPKTFSGFTGAWTAWQSNSMSDKALKQASDWGRPAKKKSSK